MGSKLLLPANDLASFFEGKEQERVRPSFHFRAVKGLLNNMPLGPKRTISTIPVFCMCIRYTKILCMFLYLPRNIGTTQPINYLTSTKDARDIVFPWVRVRVWRGIKFPWHKSLLLPLSYLLYRRGPPTLRVQVLVYCTMYACPSVRPKVPFPVLILCAYVCVA